MKNSTSFSVMERNLLTNSLDVCTARNFAKSPASSLSFCLPARSRFGKGGERAAEREYQMSFTNTLVNATNGGAVWLASDTWKFAQTTKFK